MAVNYKLIRSVIKDYFKIDKNPKKGLMTLEWVMLGYMAITIITMLFTYTKLVNPEAMLWGRLRVLVMTIALWAVYRMIPCRITKMVRIIAQMALLAWWYPDTYEINRMFPNLDHIFAGWEQDLFGCQPALLFAKALPWAVVSELMSMGYFMYYPMIGDVQYFKVMSGKVHEGDDFTNADRGSKERVAQIYACAGANRIKVEEMVAGDIGCTVKLKDVHTGNTLNGKGAENRFNFIKYPNSKYSRAIKPVNEADTEKMMVILNRMREEDPTWVIEQSKELKQTIVHGQGEFHLRTLKWRLENNEKLQVKFEEPKIPYRETITKAARADYRHKKQSGGAGQFGEVHLIVEPYYEGMPVPDTYKFGGQEFKINVKGTEEVPLEWGGKLVFVNSIVGGSIDARFLPAILKGIMSRMEQGPLTGSYARDVRVIVYDGKMHPVDSNEISFMLAGRNAFSEAFKNAGPKILEPIYDVEVFVPSDKMGDVMGDLQGRRAMIMGMSSENGYEKLVAKVPLKEMASYSTALSSLTGGRASFIMKFASYELVPSDVQDKLIKDFESKQTEE